MAAERLFSRAADQLVAVSDTQKAALVEHHGLPAGRIETVVNGTSRNAFVGNSEVRRAKRRELGIPDDAPLVGTVAVLTEQKGITYLIQAAALLKRLSPAVRFVVVGGGPLEQQLRRDAEARGVASTIHFMGWRRDVPEWLASFDVWVMSSLWEAMPVALLEAMEARLPLVVTDVGQNSSIVRAEREAIVVPPRDPAALATAVRRLLDDPLYGSALGAAAQERVRAAYSMEQMVRRYEAFYAEGQRRPELAAQTAPAPQRARSW
jgi:glycosyltransferase involved in cell wall biosynthesis